MYFQIKQTNFFGAFTQPSSLYPVPCGPTNVHANVDCVSGAVNISWSAQSNAQGYITVISDSDKQMTHYNTTEPKLSVNLNECGQEYTVKVMSFNESCISFPSELHFKEGKTGGRLFISHLTLVCTLYGAWKLCTDGTEYNYSENKM